MRGVVRFAARSSAVSSQRRWWTSVRGLASSKAYRSHLRNDVFSGRKPRVGYLFGLISFSVPQRVRCHRRPSESVNLTLADIPSLDIGSPSACLDIFWPAGKVSSEAGVPGRVRDASLRPSTPGQSRGSSQKPAADVSDSSNRPAHPRPVRRVRQARLRRRRLSNPSQRASRSPNPRRNAVCFDADLRVRKPTLSRRSRLRTLGLTTGRPDHSVTNRAGGVIALASPPLPEPCLDCFAQARPSS